uniref:Uncharacterized protein n=1 Tax=Anguilla anguilla TaxID=7936 RepID=A0A0E9RIM6_ANGAN
MKFYSYTANNTLNCIFLKVLMGIEYDTLSLHFRLRLCGMGCPVWIFGFMV